MLATIAVCLVQWANRNQISWLLHVQVDDTSSTADDATDHVVGSIRSICSGLCHRPTRAACEDQPKHMKCSLSHTRTAAISIGFRSLACESLADFCWLYHLVLANDVCLCAETGLTRCNAYDNA